MNLLILYLYISALGILLSIVANHFFWGGIKNHEEIVKKAMGSRAPLGWKWGPYFYSSVVSMHVLIGILWPITMIHLIIFLWRSR